MDVFPILNSLFSGLLLAQENPTVGEGVATASDWQTYVINAAVVLAIFVVPFVLSSLICKAIRMPSHATKLGVMLAAISGGLCFAWLNDFQLQSGIDMKGGTKLVYNIMPDENGEKIDPGSLASALSGRLNPSGTKTIEIRPLGSSQIQITVPETDEMAIRRMKELLSNSGQLEFRIVANGRDHISLIEKAKAETNSRTVPPTDVLGADGAPIGRWYRVGREDKKRDGVFPLKSGIRGDTIRDAFTGKTLEIPALPDGEYAVENWLLQNGHREVDMLMALVGGGKPFPVIQGDDLASAAITYNQTTGNPEVSFRLNAQGGVKMNNMTGRNTPTGQFKRRMAIVMDGEIISAPELNSAISSQGVIQGRFSREEVESLVTVLRSGRLPATLSKEPASEFIVGAGLGASTINKGTTASIWAVGATFACILLYYRFAGIVASIALIINGLLIFGIMIFIKQPLTLPGLAGLVLTVGMSVDANVLIFERIREEKTKGSAPRMSIRNGFDRALTTIVDSNLTTLIAAVVLYWIGTDQVRGFAVSLIIGIATSMFTATFCSRIIFEICEKLKLVSLSMSDGVGVIKAALLQGKDVDFMSAKGFSFVLSVALIALGIVAVSIRQRDLLNIDFNGGASVTFQLAEAIDAEELRLVTREIFDAKEGEEPVQSTLVSVDKEPANQIYTLETSIEDPKALAERLLAGFSAKDMEVVTYRVEYTKRSTGSSQLFSPSIRYISYQPPAGLDAQDDQTQESGLESISADEGATAPSEVSSNEAAETDSSSGLPTIGAPAEMLNQSTEFQLRFAGSDGEAAKFNGVSLQEELVASAAKLNIPLNQALIELYPDPRPEEWTSKDVSSHEVWIVKLPVGAEQSEAIVADVGAKLQQQPKWLSLNAIGGQVAGEMQQRAIGAILLSLIFIVAYIWFRFQKVAYGLAAVVALVHDVVITLGVLALCHWLAPMLGFLLIEDFKIGLTEVAAFLTIIGYSLNDTIVVFDRIREVRGRSPRLTPDMVNTSVNQTLSRTLLTSGTTLLTVLLLYVFGGEGIHAFAFALLVGILVGTYSSIFVASPVLLWITNRENAKQRVATSS